MKKQSSNIKTRFRKFLNIIILFILFIFLALWVTRATLPRQIDDISPGIPCSEEIINKADLLLVIPIYENVSIAENKSWCDYILSLNKSLALHGVYHNYNEFDTKRDQEYVQRGIIEFEKCFGFKPQIFEAPRLALFSENERMLKSLGLKVINWPNMITHKVYHCQETGNYSIPVFWRFKITNRFIDWI